MISAADTRKIAESKVSSKHLARVVEAVNIYVLSAAEEGKTSFSYNIAALDLGVQSPTPALRKALAAELEKNGYSYREFELGCLHSTWFEVRW